MEGWMAGLGRILIADDDRNLRRVLRMELGDAGWEVAEAENGRRALEMMEKEEYAVLLLDLAMPGLGGMEVLKETAGHDGAPETIVLTGHGTISTAVEAMHLGACDFLTKPFKLEELLVVVRKAGEKKRLRRENLLLRNRLSRQEVSPEIVSGSPEMAKVLETVDAVAATDFPVLILGESGVGKELVARAIHHSSRIGGGPFLPLNCGAIPETMLESELFGHEKGSFTGAVARKLGLLEVADGGTVLLDEIGEMPPPLQVKLLRVLETGSFFRIGGTAEVRVRIRCLSATNQDLKARIETGQFRADLYYRISTITIRIPPLRDRPGDIPLLIEHFRRRDPAFRGRRFSPEAVEAMVRYGWPGNVRELQNIVYRTLLIAPREVIGPEDLPADLTGGACHSSAARLGDVEREHILKILRETGGHRGQAAEILGIDPKTLYRKLQEYGR
jgi:DNA-binding NtrC family response regulator